MHRLARRTLSVHAGHVLGIALLGAMLSLGADADDCAADACLTGTTPESEWMDKSHQMVGSGVENLVGWFDRFFVTNLEEVETGTSYLRVRESLRWEEHQGYDTKTQIRARAQLPNLSKKISLTFSSDDDIDERGPAGNDLQTDLNNDNESLSLQYEVSKSAQSRLDFRYHWRASLDPMVSGRYRRDFIFSENFLTRFTQIVYWANDDGPGEESRVDFDYLLDDDRILRWRNKVHYGQETDGVEWLSQILLARQLSDQRAFTWFIGLNGETDPYDLVTNYSTGVRYRKNFYRPWLFYEVEPALNWQKKAKEDNRELVSTITFRIEAYFGDLH